MADFNFDEFGNPAPAQKKSGVDLNAFDFNSFGSESSIAPKKKSGGVFGAIKGVGKGAIKGVGSTAIGLGQLALKGYTMLPGEQPLAEEAIKTGEDIKQKMFTPETTAEKVGFGAEQIAEFFIPAGAATRGVNALQSTKYLRALNKAQDLNKLGKVVRGVGNLGVKSGVAATEAASVRAAQTGGDPEEIKKAALIGAAFPVATTAIGVGAKKALKGIASRTPTARLQELTRNLKTLQNTYDDNVIRTRVGKQVVEKSNPIQSLKIRKLVPEVVDNKVDSTKIVQILTEELESVAGQRAVGITSKKSIPFRQFKSDVMGAVKNSKDLRMSGQVTSTMNKAEKMLQDFRTSFGGRMTLETIDDIRIRMNKNYDPELRDVFRAIGDAARKNVKMMDKASRPLLEKEAEILSARNFAQALNGKVVKGGRLGAYINSILGAIVGSQIPFVGPIGGALGGRALDKAVRKAYFRAPGAETAEKLLKLGEKVGEKTRSVFGRGGRGASTQ